MDSVSKNRFLQLAAGNNAAWCEIVCAANGAPGSVSGGLWYAASKVPQFYPNIITLDAGCTAHAVHSLAQRIPGRVSIKDSFNNLALGELGYTKLFTATWYVIFSAKPRVAHYELVRSARDLEKWQKAWTAGEATSPFNSQILLHPDVRCIAITDDDQLTAGCILNRSPEVIGLTNFFCTDARQSNAWATCVAAAFEFGANMPVVGYERVLPRMHSAGNAVDLGELSVWVE